MLSAFTDFSQSTTSAKSSELIHCFPQSQRPIHSKEPVVSWIPGTQTSEVEKESSQPKTIIQTDRCRTCALQYLPASRRVFPLYGRRSSEGGAGTKCLIHLEKRPTFALREGELWGVKHPQFSRFDIFRGTAARQRVFDDSRRRPNCKNRHHFCTPCSG